MVDRAGSAGAGPAPEKSVLRRVLAILECFTEQQPEQTVASICRATGLPPATAHRMLAVLVDWGGVERTARGRYRLGLRLWRLGSLVPQTRELRGAALPYLEDLYEATHEIVVLAVLDGAQALYVEKIIGHRSLRGLPQVGPARPLHATGVGKTLLAHSPPDLLERLVRAGLRRLTDTTITKEFALRQELHAIRRDGVAISRQEATPGAMSVAAPVLARDGHIVASVSVIAPAERFDPATLAPWVRTVSRAISRQLTAA